MLKAQRLLYDDQLNSFEIMCFSNYLNNLKIRNAFLAIYYKLQYKQSILKREVSFLLFFNVFFHVASCENNVINETNNNNGM